MTVDSMASSDRRAARLIVLFAAAFGLIALVSWLVVGSQAPPPPADGSSPPTAGNDDPVNHGGAVPVPGDARQAADRVGGVPVQKAPEQAEVPVTIEEMPEDVRKDVRAAIEASRHACETLGIPLPARAWPRLRLSDARAMIRREAELKKQQLDSALMEQELLSRRMHASPAMGIRVPAAKRDTLDAALKQKYPGWPDGYRFAEQSDGAEVWVAAWRVGGDPELEQLVRDHDALTGDYSASVRAGYRIYFHY